MKQELESAISQLNEIYRSVILLRDIEELSTEETAQILDQTEDWRCARLWMSACVTLTARRREAVMGTHETSDRCREIFALLSDYLDLELPPEACQEIEAHLAGCEPSIEFTESLHKTVELC